MTYPIRFQIFAPESLMAAQAFRAGDGDLICRATGAICSERVRRLPARPDSSDRSRHRYECPSCGPARPNDGRHVVRRPGPARKGAGPCSS